MNVAIVAAKTVALCTSFFWNDILVKIFFAIGSSLFFVDASFDITFIAMLMVSPVTEMYTISYAFA